MRFYDPHSQRPKKASSDCARERMYWSNLNTRTINSIHQWKSIAGMKYVIWIFIAVIYANIDVDPHSASK
jgi:hypothetical protein